MSSANYKNNNNDDDDENGNNTIGNSYRTIEFELQQITKVFPDTNLKDFFILPNGNKGISFVFKTKGSDYNDEFEILIEFLYDYPNSPPNVHVIRPNIGGAPHTLYNKKMCYVNTSSDWNASFTSYDVLIMIQTWIYAYCKWRSNGVWDWYQDNEYIPSPLPPTKRNYAKRNVGNKQTPIYNKAPLYNCCNYSSQYQSNNNDSDLDYGRQMLPIINNNIDNNYNLNQNNNNNTSSNSVYGRQSIISPSPCDCILCRPQSNNNSDLDYGRQIQPIINNNMDNIDKGSPITIGKVIFTIIFSQLFILCNHWTALVVIPFFILLFISHKIRTAIFIILSLIIIITNPWSFVIVPLFGLLYTTKKKHQIIILSIIILFWTVMALYGYNIIDAKILQGK